MMSDIKLFCIAILTTCLLAACGSDDSDRKSDASQSVGVTAQYDWYMESVTPAGHTKVSRTGDGRISNESFIHWNNREYTLKSEMLLDEAGMLVSQTLRGISAFGAPIDESFSFADGVAEWRTPGEGGSARTDNQAYYLANERLDTESLAALVRAASQQLDAEIALFPSGSARVEKLDNVVVETPDGPSALTLYAVDGIGFMPAYAWFDAEMNVAAVDYSGWLGMVPKGWSPAVLKKLSAAQTAAVANHVARVSGNLANRIDGPVLIENVHIVDVDKGRLISNQNVLVENGRIALIDARQITMPDAVRIDGAGRFLMPGMWDMHGHFDLSDGVLNIAGGITSVRDIGGSHTHVMELTEKFDSGEVIGPTTYRAGFMDKAGPFASGWAAESLQQALDRVDFFAENGYLQIKLYSSIEPEWVKPIAERAHSHGMRLSGHIPAFMSAEQAVLAGYDEIQHINMVFLNFLAGDREDTRKQLRFTLYGDEARNLDLESEEVQSFLDLLKENDVVIDATAAIFETMLIHKLGEPDPTFAAIADHLPPSVRRPLYNPEMDMTGRVTTWAESNVRQSEMLKALYDHGIQLVPGSDNMPAFTLHRELEVYVEAGIPVPAVLRMATLGSAAVLGVDDRVGSIDVGKNSDFIFLAENPLENISAVRRAVLVMKGNTLYRPDRLYEAVGVKPFVPSVEL